MRTDTIFYTIFQKYPPIFFELLHRPIQEASAYKFTSIEVKQLAFRIDGVFMPTDEEPNRPFYLTEVQFQPDEELYYRIFAELFIYLRQYKPGNPWQVVIIYPTRRIEPKDQLQFQELLNCDRVTRIYLDELEPEEESTLGIGVVKLIIEPETVAVETAKRLIAQAGTELTNPNHKRDLIELIETIIIYKLTTKSREEIAAMLELGSWKDNRFYQESVAEGIEEGLRRGKIEGKMEVVQPLIRQGLSLEAIAESLQLPLDLVREAAEDSNSQED